MDRNDPNLSHLTANADNALSRRDYHAAAALYLKALERPSIRPYLRAALLTNLGLAWQYLDEVEKATACFEDAVAANPRLASARTGLGDGCRIGSGTRGSKGSWTRPPRFSCSTDCAKSR